MNKIIILGMLFDESNAPDVGSIRLGRSGDYILLADDIPKLNSTLTRSHCGSLLSDGSFFNVPTGALAFVADWKTEGSAKVYMYEATSDTWYEVVGND